MPSMQATSDPIERLGVWREVLFSVSVGIALLSKNREAPCLHMPLVWTSVLPIINH
jgi:hypothetical protein